MGIEKVILVNLFSGNKGLLDKGENHLGLKVLKEALSQGGFENTTLYPNNDNFLNLPYWRRAKRKFAEDLVGLIDDPSKTILGFSVATDLSSRLMEMGAIAREMFPELKIVAGGPHIKRQEIIIDGKHYFDPVFMTLTEQDFKSRVKIFDAVFQGPGSAFVEHVLSNGEKQPNGMYTLDKDGRTIIGKGSGKNLSPDISSLVFNGEKDGVMYLTALLEDYCPNTCGYCSILKGRFRSNPQKLADEIAQVSQGKLVELNLEDSAALKRDDFEPYQSFFMELRRRKVRSFKRFFLDAQDFVGEENYESRMDFLDMHNVVGFFFGRDCVDGRVAEKIGRDYAHKVNGIWQRRIRTQEDLDNEGEVLKKMIIQTNDGRFVSPFAEYDLSYIITPFDDYDSMIKMIDEAQELENLRTENNRVGVSFFNLSPYPGTKVKERYVHLIEMPLAFNTHSPVFNCWKYDMGPQVLFMDQALKIKRAHVDRASIEGVHETHLFKGAQYFNAMREALGDAYAGRLSPLPFEERHI